MKKPSGTCVLKAREAQRIRAINKWKVSAAACRGKAVVDGGRVDTVLRHPHTLIDGVMWRQ